MHTLDYVKELLQLSDKLLSWNVVMPSVFVTSVLLLLLRVPIITDILSPMDNMILGTISWCWVISIAILLYRLSYAGVSAIKNRIDSKRQQIETRTKTESMRELSQPERKILEYVQSGINCAVWVYPKDAAVQTLIHKGVLERIGDITEFCDWDNERVLCILVMLSPAIRKYTSIES